MDTAYNGTYFTVTNTTWSLLIVSGKRNYVSVRKESNNPFKRIVGKEFKNMEEAIAYYKSPAMKAALLVAEQTIINDVEGACAG